MNLLGWQIQYHHSKRDAQWLSSGRLEKWWYVLFSVSFSNKLWWRTVNHRTFSFFLWVSHHILTQLYQNYNHPDTVPEVDQSEPVLDFQEGEKENSDKKMKVKLLNILKTVSTQVLLEGQKE